MVMLADTDAGSIITAAQSGARWGYAMILPQVALIPVLFLVQEMTVRLGVATGRGHGELIRERFGAPWAALSVATLFLSSVGALITEFAGIAGFGLLFGVPAWLSVSLSTLLLVALGLSGSYRRVERVGVAVGLLELLFIPAAFMAHPDVGALTAGLGRLPLADRGYVFLVAANVGAVIMPWMVFYQQGAVCDKGLRPRQLAGARWDTLVGSVVTQAVMIAVVVATAATVGRAHPGQELRSVGEIAAALSPFIGAVAAKVVFGLAVAGASFVAALVVSIAGAYGVGEALGRPHSLNRPVRQAPLFYGAYTLAHVGGAVLVILSAGRLVDVSVGVEVMNALLLPVVLGFLLLLEARALPRRWRMRGAHRLAAWVASALVMAFGLYMAVTMV
ncbi:MAG: divalent metal cation transporter [Firmicutes bacterium]|nr:divalent metal cation transporter [Bacillota bacterium]